MGAGLAVIENMERMRGLDAAMTAEAVALGSGSLPAAERRAVVARWQGVSRTAERRAGAVSARLALAELAAEGVVVKGF